MTMNMNQRQLCEHFGWDYKTIALEAKVKGLSTHTYVQQKTGWILRQERYYPPGDILPRVNPDPSLNNQS